MMIPKQNDEFNSLPEVERLEVLDLLTLAHDALDASSIDRKHLHDAVSYQRAALKITSTCRGCGMTDKASEMVGTITRGKLYHDLALVTELLDLANNAMPCEKDGGVGAACEIAQRMVDELAVKVSP